MIVLDASAILAFLLKEQGADVTRSHVDAAVIGAVNYAEVASRLSRDYPESRIPETLKHLGLIVVAFDEALALDAGLLTTATRPAGLSLGDRCCLALGRRLSCPVLTADRDWLKIANAVGVEVQLIR